MREICTRRAIRMLWHHVGYLETLHCIVFLRTLLHCTAPHDITHQKQALKHHPDQHQDAKRVDDPAAARCCDTVHKHMGVLWYMYTGTAIVGQVVTICEKV